MSEAIVDCLEVVQVGEHDAQFVSGFAAVFQEQLRALHEMRPIGDARQAVALGQAHEMHLQALGLVRPQADERENGDEESDVEAVIFAF